MMDFHTMAKQFLCKVEKRYSLPFQIQRDVIFCEKTFPMIAQYEQHDKRYLFGIKSSISKETIYGEKCFFDYCETLDEYSFAEYERLFRQLQDTFVLADNPAHDYTFISFVLCTANLDKKIQRKIRRINDYRQYKNDQYGWSALRICVIDLETEAYYYNAMGKSLWQYLTQHKN